MRHLKIILAVAWVWSGFGCEGSSASVEATDASAQLAETVTPKPEEKPQEEPSVEEAPDPRLERLQFSPEFSNAPADAKRTKSGIAWVVLQEGEGKAGPAIDDSIWVHYVTFTPEGKRKGNSIKKNKPKPINLSKIVQGWKEMLMDMKLNERRRVWLPAKLATPKGTKVNEKTDRRIVDLELVQWNPAPKAPKNVKRPPKNAEELSTGLRWLPMSEATSDERAKADSEVVVRYAGWTTDGRCFDFTGEGETFSTRLDQVIPGWTQGIRLLAPGQKGRFWIPEKMAYKGARGKPKGMLVFDVELVEIR